MRKGYKWSVCPSVGTKIAWTNWSFRQLNEFYLAPIYQTQQKNDLPWLRIEQHWPNELQNGCLCCSPIKTTPTVDHVLFAHVQAHSTHTNVYITCVLYASTDRSTGIAYVLYRALVIANSALNTCYQVYVVWQYRAGIIVISEACSVLHNYWKKTTVFRQPFILCELIRALVLLETC